MKIQTVRGDESCMEWEITHVHNLIGRDPICDIVLDDPKLSRIHGEIVLDGETAIYHDKNSTNGSYINEVRVTSKVLMPGDIIRLGNTELQVDVDDLSKTIRWQEGASPITSSAPLDVFTHQIEELMTAQNTSHKSAADLSENEQQQTASKLIKNLETIYEVGKAISSIRSVDDLLGHIAEALLDVFPQIESICILLMEKEGRFFPKYLKSRNGASSGEFGISRSIFEQSVEKKMCILANDAFHDQRFSASESIIHMNVRSVMCAPLVNKGTVLGAIYVDNRQKPNCFDEEDVALLSALANQSAIAIDNSRLYENVQQAYHESILALINTMEAKDPYTMGHTQRTSRYALGTAREMNLSEEECKKLKTAAELHDIGKIGVSERIIDKEDKLTGSEYHSIQAHVITGEKILRPIEYLRFVLPIVRHHHERYDGSGYPDGLKEEEIPLAARIIAVADAFDAMTTKRPYNTPMSFNEALDQCIKLKGVQFDPDVVDALVTYISKNYSLPSDPDQTPRQKASDTTRKRKKRKSSQKERHEASSSKEALRK